MTTNTKYNLLDTKRNQNWHFIMIHLLIPFGKVTSLKKGIQHSQVLTFLTF